MPNQTRKNMEGQLEEARDEEKDEKDEKAERPVDPQPAQPAAPVEPEKNIRSKGNELRSPYVEKVFQAIRELVGDDPDWATALDKKFESNEWRASLREFVPRLKIEGVSSAHLVKEMGTKDEEEALVKVFAALRKAFAEPKKSEDKAPAKEEFPEPPVAKEEDAPVEAPFVKEEDEEDAPSQSYTDKNDEAEDNENAIVAEKNQAASETKSSRKRKGGH